MQSIKHLRSIDVRSEIFNCAVSIAYRVDSTKNRSSEVNGERRSGTAPPRAKHVLPFLILVADGAAHVVQSTSGVVSIQNLLY